MMPLSVCAAPIKEREKLIKNEKSRAYIRKNKEFVDESKRKSRIKKLALKLHEGVGPLT
jgi:hypothetical protein